MKYFLLLAMAYAALFTKMASSEHLLYALSRFYEGCFVYWQYNYYDIEAERWHKELSYGHKLVCDQQEYTKEMSSFLSNLRGDEGRVFRKTGRRRVFVVTLSGKEYVVKRHKQHGFFKNLIQMGKGVNIWNNGRWAEKKGLRVEKVIAFVEKRKPGSMTTYALYPYEGETLASLLKTRPELLGQALESLAAFDSHLVVHQDLRAKNMVYTKEGEIKFIDIDILHYYPWEALSYKRRMEIEKRLFKKNCSRYVQEV